MHAGNLVFTCHHSHDGDYVLSCDVSQDDKRLLSASVDKYAKVNARLHAFLNYITSSINVSSYLD